MSGALEIAMSGLCALVFQPALPLPSAPYTPRSAELLCVDASHHHTRLVVAAEDVLRPVQGVDFGWFHDSSGKKFASVELEEHFVTFPAISGTFSGEWRLDGNMEGPSPRESHWMRWVANLQSMGVKKLNLLNSSSSGVPKGWSMRVRLPPGRLKARDIVVDRNGKRVWNFEDGTRRAIADDVVLRVEGVTWPLVVTLTKTGEQPIVLKLEPQQKTLLRLGFNSDLEKVELGPYSANPLRHLYSFKSVTKDGDITLPYTYRASPSSSPSPSPSPEDEDRTGGDPICNMVRFHWTE
jgi:hypothetical protein